MKTRIFSGLPGFLILLSVLAFCGTKAWSQDMNNGTTDLKSGQTQTDVLHLTAKINGLTDELYLRFKPDATDGFDGSYDAYKLTSLSGNTVPNLYTVDANGIKYTINTFPFSGIEKTVDLGFLIDKSGSVTLTFTGIETFKSHPELGIYLLDTKNNNEIALQSTPEYTFDYTSTDDPQCFKIRFAVSITGITEKTTKSSLCNVYSFDKDLKIQYPDLKGQKGMATIYDINGRIVKTVLLDGSGSQHIALQVKTAVYFVKLVFAGYTETHKVALR